MHITSLQNPRIKHLVRLHANRRLRLRDQLMLVEGRNEISLAIAAGHTPSTIVTLQGLDVGQLGTTAAETLTVTPSLFAKLSDRENPDGWLGVFPIPHVELSALELRAMPLLIVAEALEKPGNLGAILRTADAAGVDAVIVTDRGVDLYGPNVVRASRGTLFAVPTVVTSSEDALSFLRARGIRIVAATPRAKAEYSQQDLRGPLAVAIGTEDEGLTGTWLDEADLEVRIPMLGRVNSLNVSVATALIVYEVLRQRGEQR
jgi:TrmH family RNA methyltransferase